MDEMNETGIENLAKALKSLTCLQDLEINY